MGRGGAAPGGGRGTALRRGAGQSEGSGAAGAAAAARWWGSLCSPAMALPPPPRPRSGYRRVSGHRGSAGPGRARRTPGAPAGPAPPRPPHGCREQRSRSRSGPQPRFSERQFRGRGSFNKSSSGRASAASLRFPRRTRKHGGTAVLRRRGKRGYFDPCNNKSSIQNRRSNGIHTLRKLDMETMKKCSQSDWMKTQMNSSFSDEFGCITDATDEEQDDLPYDGDVGVTCKYNNNSDNLNDCTCTKDISGILNLACSEDSKNIKATANYETHPQPEEFSRHHRDAIGTTGISVEMPGSEASFKKELPVGSFSKPDSKEHLTNSKMSNILLRHFSKGELISTCQLIECETIPETSFTESIDDTVTKPEPSEQVKGPLAHEHWATNFEEYHLEKHEEVNTGDKNQNLLNENRCVSKKPSTDKCGCRQENSQLINENEDTHIFQNMKEERALFKKTVSPHELKYGQGQAHYCLPDSSEVDSEVEVPKRCDNINSIPATERAKSFPILLSKSVIVNNILENKNYLNSAEVESQEEMSIPELLQQLEMLTQHADTQNHIDHLRLNPKILPHSDFPNASIAIYSGDTGTSSEVFTLHAPIPIQSTRGLSKARLQCGTTAAAAAAAGTVEAHCLNPSNSLPELTLGEKMSQILKDQTDQLIKKVEDFSKHMTQETFFLQDNYLGLNQLKRYLDALERNYLTAREEHRNLQLQNYKDKSINIGEFDPERKVEGEIFRLGMLLEDIQEQTDDSKRNLSSLLTSYESAHSSYSLCESSVVSSIADPPERRGIKTAFLHKNDEGEKSQTTDVTPQKNQVSLEGNKCNLCLHMLQKRAESTSRRETESLGKGGLLANKHSSNVMRFLSPEEKYAPEGLASHSQGTLSKKFNADEESMKGNTNIQERKTGTCSLFIQTKPTDLSDTNLRLRCRCPRGTRDQFKLRNYKDSVQSSALCRNKSSGSSPYSQKRISTQKAQKNEQPHELVNRLSERKNFEAAKTCYSSTYDKIILSHQYLPSKTSARRKSAINIRNRNANDSNANILSSTLDHAIQTANSLKKATERMVRAVSEDLAKVKRKQL
ncbi:protein AKNAD1 isoform X2 [Ciconia boyciana]|uniref:protein AKNAD1 isoform X2 n=1 Tax=Ciconia boyciana TaxID=52775 RepID=UPI003B9E38F9